MSMTPNSVLFITPRWARDGGVAAHAIASAGALAERGVRVSVIAAKADEGELMDGVEVIERPSLFGDGSLAERVGDVAEIAPEVIHLHQVDDPVLVGELRASAPVIVSAHGYTACTAGVHYFRPGSECGRAHGPGCIPNLIRCSHTRHPKTLPVKYRNASLGLAALQGADLAVSYSTAVDRHLAVNRISSRALVPYFPTMPARSGSGHEGRRRVVFAGRIVRPKGVAVLIRAAREVDGEFVLCGDGRELPRMRELAGKLGVAGRVHFTGWLGGGDLAQELADASVVVMPSLWPEPFGLVGIEGFACGRPAVASATGGIGDWLKDGVGGLSVPPADHARLAAALTEMLADPGRQREMGEAGRQLVLERFSPEQHVRKLLAGYAEAREVWQRSRG